MKKVSIIIPVYNCANYLERCINSILHQTYQNFEIILADDSSDDESRQIIEEYCRIDKRILAIHNKNRGGVSCSRNRAMSIASGDFITFVDADDWIEFNLIEILVNRIWEQSADISACGFIKDYYNGNSERMWNFQSKKISSREALDCLSPYYFTTVWGKLFRKSIINGLHFDESICCAEDTLFYTEALLCSKAIYWEDLPLYHYVQNSMSATSVFSERNVTAFNAVLQICQLYRNLDRQLQIGAIYRAEETGIYLMNKMIANRLTNLPQYRDIKKFVYAPMHLIIYFKVNFPLGIFQKIKRLFVYPIKNVVKAGYEKI